MSKNASTPTPTLPRGTQPLAAPYQIGKASVHYHDPSGNAYNAQQRYVGKADPAAASAAEEADKKPKTAAPASDRESPEKAAPAKPASKKDSK